MTNLQAEAREKFLMQIGLSSFSNAHRKVDPNDLSGPAISPVNTAYVNTLREFVKPPKTAAAAAEAAQIDE